MERYLVESPHSAQDCTYILEQVLALGYLTHFEWGCLDGDHTGWAIVEAESAEQARMVVPTFAREKARVVRLVKFTREDLLKSHHT
jgi:hypothetical protein